LRICAETRLEAADGGGNRRLDASQLQWDFG
jgi:hypothetical protein